MKNNVICFYLLVLMFPSWMSYSFKGSIPVHIKSIYLMPVVNQSTEFMISEILNDALNQQFNQRHYNLWRPVIEGIETLIDIIHMKGDK